MRTCQDSDVKDWVAPVRSCHPDLGHGDSGMAPFSRAVLNANTLQLPVSLLEGKGTNKTATSAQVKRVISLFFSLPRNDILYAG